jgi:ABC-type glycerol-3-phosphate transport system substrate-binding protein
VVHPDPRRDAQSLQGLGQTNKVFQPGAFPYPTMTPENTPLLTMGGINQNNGPRNGFWIPKHLSPDKLAAAIDFLQFLTAPKNVALAYSVVVNTEQTVAGKKLMTKVPAIGDPPAIKGVPYQIAGGAFQALTPRHVTRTWVDRAPSPTIRRASTSSWPRGSRTWAGTCPSMPSCTR